MKRFTYTVSAQISDNCKLIFLATASAAVPNSETFAPAFAWLTAAFKASCTALISFCFVFVPLPPTTNDSPLSAK